MRKAYGYLRVSGRGQLHGDGFPRQIQAIREYAKKSGIQIVRTFEERGISGTTDLDHCPALSFLIEALHADGVKTVIVEKVARGVARQYSRVGECGRASSDPVHGWRIARFVGAALVRSAS
jgi:DNA invertase Pin-like site-specific DNA recombinase